jgi:hypothetical protein
MEENSIASGTKVTVVASMDVPHWSTWDDDRGRTSVPTKRRLQQMFFRGDKRLTAEVMYIAKESERDKLRRDGRVKVRVRDPSGSSVVITAEVAKLKKA